mgnify:CR=1 FL=1
MDHSHVYRKLNYLLELKDATVIARKNIISNMTISQIKAIAQVARRLVTCIINPARRDVQLLERRRLVLQSLASRNVSSTRKKTILKRHHTLIPVLLRIAHLIETILDEVETTREA